MAKRLPMLLAALWCTGFYAWLVLSGTQNSIYLDYEHMQYISWQLTVSAAALSFGWAAGITGAEIVAVLATVGYWAAAITFYPYGLYVAPSFLLSIVGLFVIFKPISGGTKKVKTVPAPAEEKEHSTQIRRNGFTLAAAIIATIYVLFILVFFAGNEVYKTFPIAVPHAIISVIVVSIAWAAYSTQVQSLLLTAAIGYCLMAGTFLIFGLFMVLPIVFGFVGYAQVRNAGKREREALETAVLQKRLEVLEKQLESK
nr:MAG TPA: hypothetical protein [Caudoviricetes sp.]